MDKCTLHDPEIKQCCCNCKNLFVGYHHPISTGNPVSLKKSWVCVQIDSQRCFTDWRQHSVGCELYTPKNGNNK